MVTERRSLEVPFPDPLGLLQGEAEAIRAPVVPVDPLVGLCRRWLGGIFEARERAVENYAKALEGQPLNPEARVRAVTNYDMALRATFGRVPRREETRDHLILGAQNGLSSPRPRPSILVARIVRLE